MIRKDIWLKAFSEEAARGNRRAGDISMLLCALVRDDEELLKRLWNRIERGGSLSAPSQGENNMMLRTQCQGKP